MAPARTKKVKASPSDTVPSRSRAMAIKSPARTPIASPSKRGPTATGITAGQKQALIDNLQLEVTERARKLRAQYALQAQSLRTRIEMRINRIPSGLRKMKMGDLYEKYMQMDVEAKSQGVSASKQGDEENDQSAITAASQQGNLKSRAQGLKAAAGSITTISTVASPSRGIKRTSDTLDSDKENPNITTTTSSVPKPIPNKKQRTIAKDSSHPSHQTHNLSTVLSPKSANSRTLPPHHAKGGEPLPKGQYSTRPTSPLKAQNSPVKTKAAAAGGIAARSAAANLSTKTMGPPPQPPASKRGRKAVDATAGSVEIHDEGSIRTVSSASNASTGTTIVKKSASDGAKRGGTKVSKATTGKKTTATATVAAGEGTKSGRRVLRKR